MTRKKPCMKRKQKPLMTRYIESCQQKAKVAGDVYRDWRRVSRRWLRKERAELLAVKDIPEKETEFFIKLAFYMDAVMRAKYDPTITGHYAAQLYREILAWAEEKGGKDIAKLF